MMALNTAVEQVHEAIHVLEEKFGRLAQGIAMLDPVRTADDGKPPRIVLGSGYPEAIGDVEEKTGS